MKIVFEQLNRKISVTFQQKDTVDNYKIDKAEEFLITLDKFSKKNKIRPIRQIRHIGHIRVEFENTGVLTERIIRAIIVGLRF